MTKRTTDDWYGCPVRYGAAIFGDKWSLLVLRDLMFRGARHYAEFLHAGEGIATNILAARLSALESEGVIEKRIDPEHSARYIYALSEKGLGLVPAMLEIIDWSETWDRQTEVPKQFVHELRSNRRALAQKIVSRHKSMLKA